MQIRSEGNDESYLPQVMSMNPTDLIKWCKNRKQFLGLSNQRLADETGVPVGLHEDTPKPENADAQQVQDYYDTIEGYKLIVENKNHMIDELKSTCAGLAREIDYLKTENERKHEAFINQQEHIKWLESIVDDLRKHTSGKYNC